MRWQPYVTVAAVIADNDKFLLVEEKINGKICYNQPAGHWEPGETLIEAIKREVLEETGWKFTPTNLVQIYQWSPNIAQEKTFLRFTFTGHMVDCEYPIPLDQKIIRTHWFGYKEITNLIAQHRSPQVIRSIDDYLSGKRFSLDILSVV